MGKLFSVHMLSACMLVFALGSASATGAEVSLGADLRGAGPNLAGPSDPANIFVKCALTLGGVPVGYQASYDNGNGTGTHVFQVVGGTLTLKLANTTADVTMKNFDATIAAAFPEVANYQYVSGAQIWYSSGNISKNAAGSISWVGTGTFSKVTKVEIRCVYLVVNGKVVKCLGCHYYVS